MTKYRFFAQHAAYYSGDHPMQTPVLTVLEEDKHAWFAGRTRAILKYLDLEMVPRKPGVKRMVLDVGGGAGNMAHHLAHYGDVISVDYSARPLPVAAQRGLDTCQGSGSELPFGDDQVDLIALLDTVEHIADEFGVFDECLRVLRPGGKLIVTVPAFMWLWSYNDVINDHERRYTVPELSQKLELTGFNVSRISYNNFFLFPAIAGIRMLRPYNPDLESPHLTEEEDVYQVEMEPIPEPVNSILHMVGWVEAEMLQAMPLPFGTSVICVAEKPL
jgi:SAM-dependent methyltransferase